MSPAWSRPVPVNKPGLRVSIDKVAVARTAKPPSAMPVSAFKAEGRSALITGTGDAFNPRIAWASIPSAARPAPKPSKRVQPKYPERALEREREGTVVVILTIGAGGAVTDAQVASEEPTGMGFGSSAVAAVQRYEFAGSAPGKYTITIRFTLE